MNQSDQERAILHISQMLDAIDGIQRIVHGSDATTIKGDWIKSRALERGFEIVSEASRRLTDAIKQSEPNIPWRQIAGLGNVIRHDYDDVDVALLLVSASKDLPELKAALLRIRASFTQDRS